MRRATRHQLAHLDRSLLSLVNERARLLAEVGTADPERQAAVDDLMRRNPGPLSACGARQVFAALDQACLEVSRGPAPFREDSPGRESGGGGRS